MMKTLTVARAFGRYLVASLAAIAFGIMSQ